MPRKPQSKHDPEQREMVRGDALYFMQEGESTHELLRLSVCEVIVIEIACAPRGSLNSLRKGPPAEKPWHHTALHKGPGKRGAWESAVP